MPINYLQMTEQIPEYIQTQYEDMQRRESLQAVAWQLLQHIAQKPGEIRSLLEQEKKIDPKLRCAGPAQERMDEIFQPSVSDETNWLLIGVDGSQLTPDPHSALPFGLINSGIFQMYSRDNRPPSQHTRSTLVYATNSKNPAYLPDEDEIHLMRDLEEREILIQLAAECPDAVIALTDGPLGLFREPDPKDPHFERFTALLDNFAQLPADNRIIAGYVDRPRSDPVIQMLALFLRKNGSVDKDKESANEQFLGLRDEDIFHNQLGTGARTAVYEALSPSSHYYQDDLTIHFFYINVGTQEKPSLVRIEIPRWVANNLRLLQTLHTQILAQCQILGSKPYPYLLHRAHEIAIVHQDEKAALETMMMKQWLDAGHPYLELSNKQYLKNLVPGHRR